MALPQEVEWNIIKFMSHPCADIIKEAVAEADTYDDHFSLGIHDFSSAYFQNYYFNNYCDACCERWSACNCWCSNCHEPYADCKAECYEGHIQPT